MADTTKDVLLAAMNIPIALTFKKVIMIDALEARLSVRGKAHTRAYFSLLGLGHQSGRGIAEDKSQQ